MGGSRAEAGELAIPDYGISQLAKDKVDEIFHGKRPSSAPELFELRRISIELGRRFGENFEACLRDAKRMVWAFGRPDHQASRPLGS
jgi:hypothetical protein